MGAGVPSYLIRRDAERCEFWAMGRKMSSEGDLVDAEFVGVGGEADDFDGTGRIGWVVGIDDDCLADGDLAGKGVVGELPHVGGVYWREGDIQE
jgi:hypothetical protein